MTSELQPTIGGEIIRPIRMTDVEMESDFIHRLSPHTKHYRFLAGVNELPPGELPRL